MVSAAPGHEFICVGDAAAFAALPLVAGNVRLVTVPQGVAPTDAASADGHRAVRDMWRLARATARVRPDVFFSPSVYTYYPLMPGVRSVVTVHDAIAERFPSLTLPSARARLFWSLKMKVALRQATLVLTVSDFAAREIETMHRIRPSRIRVALEAPADAYHPASDAEIDAAAAAAGLEPGARWFIYVGGFSPHKRLDVILRAHAAVAATEEPPHLLLVGRLDGDAFLTSRDALRSLVARLGTEHLVKWTGFLADDQVRGLNAGAVASLLPSECEGFGLPAVEAAACGTPVIATTESPLPQLLEGGGYFVAPGDQEALADGMRRLLRSEGLRTTMGARARSQAAKLSWARTARSALAAIEEAAA